METHRPGQDEDLGPSVAVTGRQGRSHCYLAEDGNESENVVVPNAAAIGSVAARRDGTAQSEEQSHIDDLRKRNTREGRFDTPLGAEIAQAPTTKHTRTLP